MSEFGWAGISPSRTAPSSGQKQLPHPEDLKETRRLPEPASLNVHENG